MYLQAYCTGDCDTLESVSVLVCNEAATTCYPMSVRPDGAPFDVSDLEATQISAAFAAGFVVVATAMMIGKGARIVLSMIGR